MPLLNSGDPFPRLTISTTHGQALTVPDAFAGDFAVVLLYRGAWCLYCNAQLRAFERAGQALADAGIRVAAFSVDDKETTAALVEKHKLTFPVGYGADAEAVAALTDAFVNPDPVYLQSTGFVLDPAGNVVVSVYSSGAIGRLVPDDVVGLVRYLRERPAPATA
jgi:peroxiredoxin